MRLQCLHDGYDYSSASIFTVQNESNILGAVAFATDRGDTHISLDRLKNTTIKAKDLRLRLLFEGNIADLKLPDNPALNSPLSFTSGPVTCDFHIAHAVFGDYSLKIQTGRDGSSAWLDVILYAGDQKDINFAEISEAAVIFTLSINTQGKAPASTNQPSIVINQSTPGRISAVWHNMSLNVPTKPMKTSDQNAAASAKQNGKDPWKSLYPDNP
jgi:hypothetical protein